MNNDQHEGDSTNPSLAMRGIVTVLNTPFSASGAVDHDGLARHVAYALDAGVHGFLAPAMAGEVTKLTDQERYDLTRTMLDAVQGRVPVIGCATTALPTQRAAMAAALTALGCDGVLAAIPFTSEADFTAQVHAVAETCPGFLMLQDWDAVGTGIPVPVITRLFEKEPRFRCVKIEVQDAGRKYTEVLEATKGRLHVSGGWAVTQMLEGLDRGVHAFMPTALHRTYVTIYERYATGDRAGAQALHRRLTPILAFSNQHLDISIYFFKRLLHRQGIYPTPALRDPAYLPDSFQERIADELIDLALALEEDLADSRLRGHVGG